MCKNAPAGCQGCPASAGSLWRSPSVVDKDSEVPPDDDTFPFRLPQFPVVVTDPAPVMSSTDLPQRDPHNWCGQHTD